MEELSTIKRKLDKDLTFEYRDNIHIEDVNDTTKGADTAGVELETPGVEVELGTPKSGNMYHNPRSGKPKHQ